MTSRLPGDSSTTELLIRLYHANGREENKFQLKLPHHFTTWHYHIHEPSGRSNLLLVSQLCFTCHSQITRAKQRSTNAQVSALNEIFSRICIRPSVITWYIVVHIGISIHTRLAETSITNTVDQVGFEPTTLRLPGDSSTTKLSIRGVLKLIFQFYLHLPAKTRKDTVFKCMQKYSL